MSWRERDPKKRKVKPVEQPLYDLDLESSDDSDFDPDEHKEVSDDSLDSNDEGSKQGSGSSDDSEDDEEDSEDSDLDEAGNSKSSGVTPEELQERLNSADSMNSKIVEKVKKTLPRRCWGCLGDRNDEFDELVECDSCGATVHEKCYGMSDSDSLASVDSSNPDLPWFCDTCRAGVKDPPCELCPNSGGIFKETDVGRWVHLACALYIPGLFPSDGEKLSLFKMPYAKFGAKLCTLCEDERLARTGVCIECDAGMCRTYFHASCAQRMGLLQEAHPEETETVDKFYAHCKLHSDKAQIKRRRQNFILMQNRLKERNSEQEVKDQSAAEVRIQRKFQKARKHYFEYRQASASIFVPPTQKMPRPLITSATACRLLWRKAELAGLNTQAMDIQEAQIASLKDVNRKWHIPPAFSVEFIAYFLDRVPRISKMKKQLQDFMENNVRLLDEQKAYGEKYEKVLKSKDEEDEKSKALKEKVKMFHEVIHAICPRKNLPSIESLCKTSSAANHFPHGVPTAAALKAFPFSPNQSQAISGALVNSNAVSHLGASDNIKDPRPSGTAAVLGPCGICHQSNDPHLLAHCDNCKQYYHLGCLNPPLTRMPKKTKIFGWQCSECDRESSGSDVPCLNPEAPRKLRHKSDKVPQVLKSDVENVHNDSALNSTHASEDIGNDADGESSLRDSISNDQKSKNSKKRRREKRRYSPGPESDVNSLERKRKRKKKSFDHENWQVQDFTNHPLPHVPKIKIKTITPTGEGQMVQTYVASAMTSDEDVAQPVPSQSLVLVPSAPASSAPPASAPVSSASLITVPAPSAPASLLISPSATAMLATSTSAPALSALLSSATPLSPTLSSAPASSPSDRPQRQSSGKKVKVEDILTQCDQCQGPGSKLNLVRCDECKKCYHFHCLDPPVKKSPKYRGYSWHCADCDPSEKSSNED